MTAPIPYRAAGTFAGASYIERDADAQLLHAIRANQRYPYIVAPRQSGKSSLLLHARRSLDPDQYRDAFADLSTFEVSVYDNFWHALLDDIAETAGLDPAEITPSKPEHTFHQWLSKLSQQLVVFIDEIDTLLDAPFREQFFSKLRSLFNKRAERPILERLTFVLAGAAHPAQLIHDRNRSPFNVGIEIALDNLTPERVATLVSHLQNSGGIVTNGVAAAVYDATSGSVYLCQLLLERLWTIGEQRKKIFVADVQEVIDNVIVDASSEIHFQNMYNLTVRNTDALRALGRLIDGLQIEENAVQDLRIIGISDGIAPFRTSIYMRVFGLGGPLDLVRLINATPRSALIQLTSETDAYTSNDNDLLIHQASTDEELLVLFREGSRLAGQILSKRYLDHARRIAVEWINPHADDLEDLVQQALVRALYREYSGNSFRPMFFAILRNVLADAKRRSRRSVAVVSADYEDALSDLEDTEFDVESMVGREEDSIRIRSALITLPLDHQIVLKLRYWDELTSPMIANLLGLPIGTVSSRLRYAHRSLTASLRDGLAPFQGPKADVNDWLKSIDLEIQHRYHDKD